MTIETIEAAPFSARLFLPDSRATRELVENANFAWLRTLVACGELLLADSRWSSFHDDIHGLLVELDSLDDDAHRRRLSSPLLRSWLRRLATGLAENDAVAVAAALPQFANMRVDLAAATVAPTVLTAAHGVVCTWDCGMVLPADGRARVSVRSDGEALLLHGVDEADPYACIAARRPIVPAATTRLPDTNVVVRNDIPELRIVLDESGPPSREAGFVAGAVDTGDRYYGDRPHTDIVDAAALLQQAWPEEYADWRETLHVVVPRRPPRGWQMDGFTISTHQGACWIGAEGLRATYEALVHEQSHVKQRYLEATHRLLAMEQESTTFAVGWRTDPRPIVGIHEGVYVHLHSVIALQRALDGGHVPARERDEFAQRIPALLDQIRDGLRILRDHGRYTEHGNVFLEWATATAASLRAGS